MHRIAAMMMDDGFHTQEVNHLAFLKIKKCKITCAWEEGSRSYGDVLNDNLHGCLHMGEIEQKKS